MSGFGTNYGQVYGNDSVQEPTGGTVYSVAGEAICAAETTAVRTVVFGSRAASAICVAETTAVSYRVRFRSVEAICAAETTAVRTVVIESRTAEAIGVCTTTAIADSPGAFDWQVWRRRRRRHGFTYF